MERRPKRGSDDWHPHTPESIQPGCSGCNDSDGGRRSGHQLRVARDGLDALHAHLQQHHALWLDTPRRQQSITDICHWIADEMRVWRGIAHSDTGHILAWWEARNLVHSY